MASATLSRAVAGLEALIAADPGGRGIAHITLPGQLRAAARAFAAATSVLVLTGFPCRVGDTPPTESDGPPGAVALVAAALRLGKRAALVTDECNAAALQAGEAYTDPWAAAGGAPYLGARDPLTFQQAQWATQILVRPRPARMSPCPARLVLLLSACLEST